MLTEVLTGRISSVPRKKRKGNNEKRKGSRTRVGFSYVLEAINSRYKVIKFESDKNHFSKITLRRVKVFKFFSRNFRT